MPCPVTASAMRMLLLWLLVLAAAATTLSSRGVTGVPECTSASYCPSTCTSSGLPINGNTASYLPLAGSERHLMGNSTGERQLHASVVRMVDVPTPINIGAQTPSYPPSLLVPLIR